MQKDAYTLILEAIEGGFYKPGDRLVESELAERLGVSRTPVREALQRLETQAMLIARRAQPDRGVAGSQPVGRTLCRAHRVGGAGRTAGRAPCDG